MLIPRASWFAVCVILRTTVSLVSADVIHVDASLTTGSDTGQSWTDAFRGRLGLQRALAAAQSGDEIWIADGVYAPAGTNGDRFASFEIPSGVSAFGGFAGGELQRDARDPAANPAILTGDLNGNGQRFSSHVVAMRGADENTILDGVTIRRGNADSVDSQEAGRGGCIVINGGAPRVLDCVIADGDAFAGGGMCIMGSATPLIERCTFTGSVASLGCNLLHTGGSRATIRACRFVGFSEITGGTAGVGIFSGWWTDPPDSSQITIEDCYFSIVEREFSCPSGVAIHIASGEADVRRCDFIDNKSCGAGAVHCDGVGRFDRCVFIGNEGRFDGGAAIFAFDGDVTVTNSLFAGNDREGFSTIQINGGRSEFVNCTFFSNGSTTPGPAGSFHSLLMFSGSGPHLIRNCIIWGNRSGDGDRLAVFRGNAQQVGLRFDRSLVQTWNGSWPGENNFAADPLFVNTLGADGTAGTPDDDLRLANGSPAIDRGDNCFVSADALLDVAGLARFRDDPAVTDNGAGEAPIVDVGAHERQPPCDQFVAADLNCDCAVNNFDIDAFVLALSDAAAYDDAYPGCDRDRADVNADGQINNFDIDPFVDCVASGGCG
ncbi:MAG: right-handed parallel beta-helix repeat-containing protein [Phycisphaerales bacterium]|nr:right-handed parallel beta-helix repeat-containing protein [Phycisphaerales bacterium]